MGSAAALTLGSHTVPVYEIYKVGAEPAWVEGLDLLGEMTGLHAAVVPHYDNAEGGTHDTRFCYLGEPRLAALEADLPDEVGVLGVDEHTAAILDLSARTLEVRGNGLVSVRRRGGTTTFTDGQRLAVRRPGRPAARRAVGRPHRRRSRAGPRTSDVAEAPATSLRAEAESVPRRVRPGARRPRRGRVRAGGAGPRAGDRRLERRHPAERRPRRGAPGAARDARPARRPRRRSARRTRARPSRRTSTCCSTCARLPATPRTSRPPTWSATASRRPVSRCATRPQGAEWVLPGDGADTGPFGVTGVTPKGACPVLAAVSTGGRMSAWQR